MPEDFPFQGHSKSKDRKKDIAEEDILMARRAGRNGHIKGKIDMEEEEILKVQKDKVKKGIFKARRIERRKH